MIKKTLAALLLGSVLSSGAALAADYVIDHKEQHAFVNFKISHLGFSWLYGTFKDFEGTFSYDEAQPEDSKVNVNLRTASLDSNHAERDKHLRSADFLNTSKHPQATFVSTKVVSTGEGTADISGDLTLNGVTKEIVIYAYFIGQGDDPWGGYRAGFLGPTAKTVELTLAVEGVRQ